jgi:hypothetical protein
MDDVARAYELQDILKKERQQVRQHDEEYQILMKRIIASKELRLGDYEVIEEAVQKKSHIISDKFRAKWPDKFNRLATVTMKAARTELDENELADVIEINVLKKPVIRIYNELHLEPQSL